MTRSKIAIWVAMYALASYPLIMGILQLVDYYMVMVNGSDGTFPYFMMIQYNSPFLLVICLMLSYWQRFCIYHKATIISILFIQIFPLLVGSSLPTLSVNLIILLAIFTLLISLLMCAIHFYIQIKYFIRYVKSKE